jgi:uncharacterized protein (DUF1778 family)
LSTRAGQPFEAGSRDGAGADEGLALGRGLDLYGKPPYASTGGSVRKIKRTSVTGSLARSRRPKKGSERKTARMELRLTPSSKRVIAHAVALSGLGPSELAYEAARRVVEDHERFVLRDADREIFLRAVMNPPPPNPRLVEALRRHRRSGG